MKLNINFELGYIKKKANSICFSVAKLAGDSCRYQHLDFIPLEQLIFVFICHLAITVSSNNSKYLHTCLADVTCNYYPRSVHTCLADIDSQFFLVICIAFIWANCKAHCSGMNGKLSTMLFILVSLPLLIMMYCHSSKSSSTGHHLLVDLLGFLRKSES